jgi:hypothetical protein
MWELTDERSDRSTLLIRASTNAPSRVHCNAKPGDDDLFYQFDGGHFRLYDPAASLAAGPRSGAGPPVEINCNGRIHGFMDILAAIKREERKLENS